MQLLKSYLINSMEGNSMNAKELLASLQMAGRTYYSNQEFLHKNREGLKSEEYKGLIKLIEENNKTMPTDYQESHFYHMVKESFDSLEETLNNNEIKFEGITVHPEKIPLFGTTDFKGYNAFVEADGEEKVIVFNNDLLKFTQYMIEIYAKEHWLSSKGLMNKNLKKILAQNFVDVMLCYEIFSDAYATIPLAWCEISDLDDLDNLDKILEVTSSVDDLIDFDQYFLFENQITKSVYQWIAAHEYAHIVLGHLNSNIKSKRIDLSGHTVKEFSFSYQKEYDADLLGTIITLQSSDLLFPANGICLAMYCILLSHLYEESEISLSHPPIQDRMDKVFSFMDSNKEFLVTNYRIVENIIISNFRIYKKVINEIVSNEMRFASPLEMQKFVYKNCNIFSELLQ